MLILLKLVLPLLTRQFGGQMFLSTILFRRSLFLTKALIGGSVSFMKQESLINSFSGGWIQISDGYSNVTTVWTYCKGKQDWRVKYLILFFL